MKPILFNTEMVRAILDGRKTSTRRLVKPQPKTVYHDGTIYYDDDYPVVIVEGQNGHCEQIAVPYRPGDILYVRETWCQYGTLDDYDRLIDGTEGFYYRADGENPTPFNDFLVQHPGWDEHRETPIWHPSIHMPKEAARLFLRVTDVRVERLQDITEEQAEAEGCTAHGGNLATDAFESVWQSTIKSSESTLYGWEANPWVWVIEFKRISKKEAFKNA